MDSLKKERDMESIESGRRLASLESKVRRVGNMLFSAEHHSKRVLAFKVEASLNVVYLIACEKALL